MKTKIHPPYHTKVKVTCSCGNEFEVGSTQEKIDVEVCSACHPFYTGKQRLVDTAGRVEKFQERLKRVKSAPVKEKKAEKKTRKDDTTKLG